MHMNTTEFYAHITPEKRVQEMADHEKAVANLARQFAAQSLGEDWADFADILGVWHDLGKYQKKWQEYLRKSVGIEKGRPMSVPHSGAGALHAKKELLGKLAQIASYCIASHHSGLYDYVPLRDRLISQEERSIYEEIKVIAQTKTTIALENQKFLEKIISDKQQNRDLHLVIRMLFSCLVDADFLDTESFMMPEKGLKRKLYNKINEFSHWKPLRQKLAKKTNSFVVNSEINKARSFFLDQCIFHGKNAPKGIYSLHLPTGGGKTLSSIAWAIEAAEKHQLERIIIVLPFTSIITQTSQILRNIFGDEYILEHHSDIDVKENLNLLHKDKTDYISSIGCEEAICDRIKMLSENWQGVPIIITTNVQFFESLFSGKTSKCRKIHSIANSVLIFDECQAFPTEFLNPMLRTLDSLYSRFGAQILLCTATQPVFNEKKSFYGSNHDFFTIKSTAITDVVPYDKNLFSCFNRVQYDLNNREYSSAELAEELSKSSSALCILNTRGDACAVYQALKKTEKDLSSLFHLSRMMCSAHLKERLQMIQKRILKGEPTKVICTQLIEAGVDIDFPLVYRAFTGLDSIIQAAGRCNREGKLERGFLYTFKLKDGSEEHPSLKQKQYATESVLLQNESNICMEINPEQIKTYYRNLYRRSKSFDAKDIGESLWKFDVRESLKFDFKTVQEKFRLIDDEGSFDVFVPYSPKGKEIFEQIERREKLSRSDIQYLQRLRVGIREKDLVALLGRGSVSAVNFWGNDKNPLFVLVDPESYSSEIGIIKENHYIEEPLTV